MAVFDPQATVLTFGEIMMRLSPPNNLRLEQTTSLDMRFGGAEANTAFSLALQGDTAAFISVVPQNRIGDMALRTLSSYGVDVSRVVRQGDRLGTYYFEIGASQRGNSALYDRKYSAMNLAAADVFDWPDVLKGVGVFYLSGVAPAVSTAMAQASLEGLKCARELGITTVLDVNYRGKLWSPEDSQACMRKLLPYVDVVIANDEDAPAGLGMTCVSGSLSHGIAEKDGYITMAQELRETYGCTYVASVIRDIQNVERSQWMGMLYDGAHDTAVFSPVHDVNVLEGVAAGDAFNAGLIHALLHGFDQQYAINYAIAASVLKLSIRGDLNMVGASEIAALADKGGGTRVER